jgi:phosphoglycolate phosphatase
MNVDEKRMDCKAIIFDLDGTLLDTLVDIADAANRALAERGFPPHEHQAYRWFVGDGSRRLMTRALPANQRTPETIDACLIAFIAAYHRRWNRATHPYTGIIDLLGQLTRQGIQLAVVTNKPHRFTGDMMAHYFSEFPFDPILGQMEGVPKKPHPRQALNAADLMGVRPKDCIFIGDSGVDMQTACGAGMLPIGAGWGFRPAKELNDAGAADVIAHPLDLLRWV